MHFKLFTAVKPLLLAKRTLSSQRRVTTVAIPAILEILATAETMVILETVGIPATLATAHLPRIIPSNPLAATSLSASRLAQRYTATPTSRTIPAENYRSTQIGKASPSFTTLLAIQWASTLVVSSTSNSVMVDSRMTWVMRIKANLFPGSSRSMCPVTRLGAQPSTLITSK